MMAKYPQPIILNSFRKLSPHVTDNYHYFMQCYRLVAINYITSSATNKITLQIIKNYLFSKGITFYRSIDFFNVE